VKLRFKRIGLIVLAPVALVACGQTSTDELTQWMDEQRKAQKVRIVPVAPPTKFVPQAYAAAATADPYNSARLSSFLKKQSGTVDTSGLVKPELVRRKEPLESLPLDTMAYVGSLVQDGKPVAMVRVNGLIYQVRAGNYLGQNYGRVMRITEAELSLREIVQDTEGEWSERPATLQMTQTPTGAPK
jgi:type IV pilus assembly protein PilP